MKKYNVQNKKQTGKKFKTKKCRQKTFQCEMKLGDSKTQCGLYFKSNLDLQSHQVNHNKNDRRYY